ncbi:MAG: leucyl aminopeptidase family protein [Alphaproteobacteria bacterium]|nr:leucyl aminopeptidase family protein [Alphaproteobacteria bacterium]
MSSLVKQTKASFPLFVVAEGAYKKWLAAQPATTRRWLANFKAAPGAHSSFPDAQGRHGKAVAIIHDTPEIWDLAALPLSLPEGSYRFATSLAAPAAETLALGWELGAYQFTRYKQAERQPAKLVWPQGVDAASVTARAAAIRRGRDLINTPAEDMGPADIAAAVQEVAQSHGAKIQVIIGEDLLKKNFPLIHAVGRASHRPPRLIDLHWGNPKHPSVTLVGKGVCFDTGGLDLKPSSAMYLMKKDMGGAASALAAAEMIMAHKLPICLRLLIPTADNAVSGNAFRPTDIFKARNGLTIEIGNTDAEGRLLLADALAAAVEEKPGMLIDFATLTGAARTALGTGLPALFCNDDLLAEAVLKAGTAQHDRLWRLPLEASYRCELKAKIADLNSAPNSAYAGAITAALFLEFFVGKARWMHIDMMGWNLGNRPGRPEGGEPMTARTVFALMQNLYGTKNSVARENDSGKNSRRD